MLEVIFTSVDVLGNVYMGLCLRGRAGITRGMLDLQGCEQTQLREDALELLRSLGLALVPESRLCFPNLAVRDNLVPGAWSGLRRSELGRRGKPVLLVEQNVRASFGVAERAVIMHRERIARSGVPNGLVRLPKACSAYFGDTASI